MPLNRRLALLELWHASKCSVSKFERKNTERYFNFLTCLRAGGEFAAGFLFDLINVKIK